MSSNQEEEPGSDVACAAVVQSEQIIRRILQTYQFVQSQASRDVHEQRGRRWRGAWAWPGDHSFHRQQSHERWSSYQKRTNLLFEEIFCRKTLISFNSLLVENNFLPPPNHILELPGPALVLIAKIKSSKKPRSRKNCAVTHQIDNLPNSQHDRRM